MTASSCVLTFARNQVEAFDTVLKVGDPNNLVARTSLDYELNQTMTKNTEIRMYLPDDDITGPGITVSYLPNFMPVAVEENLAQSTSQLGDYFYFSFPENLDRSLV
jgi:hypothetical protein